MTAEEEIALIKVDRDERGRVLPFTRDQVVAVLRQSARRNPPSRFAIYGVCQDDAGFDGAVVAWGLGYEDHLDVRSSELGVTGSFSSVATMSLVFGESCEIVWIDPEPQFVQPSLEEAAV